jgi:DNA-nicking Smr family endonuclease
MGRRRKGLSPEDRDLWDRVKRSAKPLSSVFPKKATVQAPKPRPEPPPDEPPPPTLEIKPFRMGETAAMASPRPGSGKPVADAPVRMQHKTHRRMVRGKLKPEARIDLHGMTLADAHPALIRFVSGAWDRGLRLVLVITGKGSTGEEDVGPIPARRGVLRQQVPGWLSAPPLSAFVLEVREAHQKHGGGGAYYVYLRRRR